MKPKFEEFNDGYVGIYKENNDEKLERAIAYDLRYGDQNISFKRHYAARAVDENIDKLIHIPLTQDKIDTDYYAIIDGEQYNIEKVDFYKKNLPPIAKLMLKKIGKQKMKAVISSMVSQKRIGGAADGRYTNQ